MADQNHVEILLAGVSVWNDWRKNNPEVVPIFFGFDVWQTYDSVNPPSFFKLESKYNDSECRIKCLSVNWSGIDFHKVQFSGCNFIGVNLTGANFDSAVDTESCFDGAELQRANFENFKSTSSSFRNSILVNCHTNDKTWFINTDFKKANFWRADLTGTDFLCSHFEGANIREANFSGSNITSITYDKFIRCSGTRISSSYGNQMFRRFVMDKAYIAEFRKRHPWLYWVWYISSDCGRSLFVWTMWSLFFAVLFGVVFAEYSSFFWLPEWMKSFLENLNPEMAYLNGLETGWFTPYYFSIVTFTTLGFGDITPLNTAGQIWLTLEVVIGYVMLGGLVSILANKLARRSG